MPTDIPPTPPWLRPPIFVVTAVVWMHDEMIGRTLIVRYPLPVGWAGG